jgi:thiol:disulfide interchange protein DsbD
MGLRFELEHGWHVYWQNPGDSGGPPEVFWEPRGGAMPGEFEWPAPERIPLGPLVNYGYTNEVVLPFRVRLTNAIDPKSPAAIGGEAKWLVCHEICIPGRARLSLALPVPPADRGQVATWRQQIEAGRGRVPKPAPASWRPRVTAARDEFALTFTAAQPVKSATFFPIQVSQVKESAPQTVTIEGRGVTIRLKKSDQLVNEPKSLRGVVMLGSVEAYVVEALVAPPVRPHRSK